MFYYFLQIYIFNNFTFYQSLKFHCSMAPFDVSCSKSVKGLETEKPFYLYTIHVDAECGIV